MITIHELLEDPTYKAFFLQVPKIPPIPGQSPPWRLYVKLKGEKQWRKRDFETYPDAFRYLKKLLKRGKVADAAISCKRISFPPPVRWAKIKGKYVIGSDNKKRQAMKQIEWKPRLTADHFEDHDWCPWCRRPTLFKYYTKHPALARLGMPIDPSVRRCNICGASTRISQYRSLAS